MLHGEPALSQTVSPSPPDATFPVLGEKFTADHLGNIYWISGSTLLKVYSHKGTQNSYSNASLGDIRFVDVSDPFNILVFHGELQRVVWLDRNLAPKDSPKKTPFAETGYLRRVTGSEMGGFWAYDPIAARIIHYTQGFNIQAQTLPLHEVLPRLLAPAFFIENEGRLFVSQPDIGIAVFDLFGNFSFFIDKIGLDSFQVLGSNIFFFSETELISYNFIQRNHTIVMSFESPVIEGKIAGNTVYVLTPTGLYTFGMDSQ